MGPAMNRRRFALAGTALLCLLLLWVAVAIRSSPQVVAEPDVSGLPYQPAPAERLTGQRSLVVAYHPQAREAGERMLQRGGNAFDAFVAATLAECVLAEGASSLAGSLGALLYDARGRRTWYLDADFNDPLDRDARWDARHSAAGRAVLVPGTVAGLEAISKRFGALRFADAIAPAFELATNGFPINPLYAGFIVWRKDVLERSDYGRQTLLPSGRPLATGDRLTQPQVARLLSQLRERGSAWMYTGDWAREFLDAVKSHGGALTADDLKRYQPIWAEPWTAPYRGDRVETSSSRSYGGVWLLTALNVASHADMASGRAWESAAALERELRIARQVWGQTWIVDYKSLDDRAFIQQKLQREWTRELWNQVQAQLPPPRAQARQGSHSYQIIVADDQGNVISGTHTINAEPWGEGIFVQGVPLTAGGMIPWQTRPGERRLGGFTNFFVWHDGRIAYAGGTISNSLVEAAFQFVVNFMDHHLPPEAVVSVPRFGTFPVAADSPALLAFDTNWLDPRVDAAIVRELTSHGLKLKQTGIVDTGLGAVLVLGSKTDAVAGPAFSGAVAPVPYVASAFETGQPQPAGAGVR
jgi:gamma-glutamyltranspeptidase/glutathione hydrolase